jgi:UTP--glucose-1-phosphate uridylyltransferase
MHLPRLRDDVRIDRTEAGTFAVRDGQGRDVAHLSEPGLWLLVRLDGAGEPDELLAGYRAEFGEALPPEELDAWIAELDAASLLVRDSRAAEVLRILHRHGLKHRRPGPERRAAREGDGRRGDGNQTAWFDRALFLLNEGDVDGALEIFDAFVAEDPAGARIAELAAILRAWQVHGGDERRDLSWRTFDAALEGLLRAGTCPACGAPFEVRPGTNRCRACGRSFTSWLLDHSAGRQRSAVEPRAAVEPHPTVASPEDPLPDPIPHPEAPVSPLDALGPDELADLQALGFDPAVFTALVQDYVAGTFPPNRLSADVRPPPPGAVERLAPAGTMQGDAFVDAGRQLLQQGRVGLVVLNGGMATRFGGRVKGVVDALPGRSFLALQAARLKSIRDELGTAPPWLLMNSQATDGATGEHLDDAAFFGLDPSRVRSFLQSGAPRISPEGEIVRQEDGSLWIYGPGHGDLAPCLRGSGALAWARDLGVEILLMANVDNLGASLDPALVGHFAASGAEMMAELAPKDPGDVGGAPASVDGRVQIVEGFAFPEGFDQDSIPVFNTNTLWFRVDALDREFPMRWYAVDKVADGIPVVQFERLVGQLSWFLETAWLEVPRDRFLPVKAPSDLEDLQPRLRQMFGGRLPVL